ncbi:MAG: metallophosphoesterase [Lachnospiraceae bacterium]|nr:metallophosphoesterase [Lachnospiraceae bacterium]
MLALILSPLYIFATWLIALMVNRWLKACFKHTHILVRVLIYGLFIFAASAMPIGFLLPYSKVKFAFQHYGSMWLGVLMYSMFPACIYLIFCLIWRIVKKKKGSTESMKRPREIAISAASVGIIFTLVICIYGFLHATDTRITNYTVELPKKNCKLDELNVVMVADMHMGCNIGVPEIDKMVELINQCDPDIVFICGDIFDNIYDALDNPERLIASYRGIKSRYGIYACYGNHDIDEPVLAGFTFNQDEKKVSDPRMDEFLEKAGITLLRDNGVLIADSFFVYGRPDYMRPGRGITLRDTPKEVINNIYYMIKAEKEGWVFSSADEDPASKWYEFGQFDIGEDYELIDYWKNASQIDYPTIVLDHEPRELEELAEAGVDLTLSGHTHDGQIFPANILLSLISENSYGYKKIGDMDDIVTSGVGLFGPYMRVGTISEVCNIKIKFTE